MALRTLRTVLLAPALALPIVLMALPAGATPQPSASTPINCTPIAGGAACPTPEPTTPYGGLDHFLCYDATSDPFSTPPVTVQDQFGTLGPLQPQTADATGNPSSLNWFCNPFQKTLASTNGAVVSGPVYGVSNPKAHLLCVNDSGPASGTEVTVTNQLGSATLVVGAPTRLCMPTWKFDDSANPSNDLAAAGSISPSSWTDPSNLALNHFQCYQVSIAAGTTNGFSVVTFNTHDQFDYYVKLELGGQGGGMFFPPVPSELCAPAVKTVVDASGQPLTPPSEINSDGFSGTHLLCFPYQFAQVSTTNTVPALVRAGNQFSQSPSAGTPGAVPSPVNVDLNNTLAAACFPTFKAIVPPPLTPEVSSVLLLPLAGLAIVATALIVVTRRRRLAL